MPPQPEENEEVTEEVKETGSGSAGTGNPAPEDSGNPGGSGPEVVPEENPAEPAGTKGKGPISKESGKAPAAKPKLSTSAEGVREQGTNNAVPGRRTGTGPGVGRGRYSSSRELYRPAGWITEVGRNHGQRLRGRHRRRPVAGGLHTGRGH